MPKAILDPLGDDLIPTPERYSITSYGADYPVDSLVSRIESGAIHKPDFQREYVWTHPQASRFIESILLGLPVPGIFLAVDKDSGKLLILDGLQRLLTLYYFFSGRLPSDKAFLLKGVHEDFLDRAYDDLDEPDRLRLSDYVIHATIVRQDEPEEDSGSIYYLFERINTSGSPLSPQEIRTSIYHGPFIDLLSTLNKNLSWRDLFGSVGKRMRDQEMILRFFAMFYFREHYSRPMKLFLNKFLGHNRKMDHIAEAELSNLFTDCVSLLAGSVGPSAFRPGGSFNAAAFDSIMVGLATRLSTGSAIRADTVQSRIEQLHRRSAFRLATTKSTADEQTVASRMSMAINAFK